MVNTFRFRLKPDVKIWDEYWKPANNGRDVLVFLPVRRFVIFRFVTDCCFDSPVILLS